MKAMLRSLFLFLFLLFFASGPVRGASPAFTAFIGTNGITIRSNTTTGKIVFDGRDLTNGMLNLAAGMNTALTTNGSDVSITALISIYTNGVFAGTVTNFSLTNILAVLSGQTMGLMPLVLPGTVTNVTSLSTSNATSKPLTNSYSNGILKLYGLEAGANTTVTPNGSNHVIASSSPFNSLPQSQTNYLPFYDRRMAWGSLSPNNTVTPLVSQGTLGTVNLGGTVQNDIPPSATNSHYGVIRATGATIGATISPASATLFEPTNRVFQFTATLGFSNAPGTNEMHCGMVNNNTFSFADTSAHIGWFAETKGSSQTNWLAQYKSNNTAVITVYTSTAMTDQWHTLGVANTNGNTLVWFLDGLPVATLTTPGMASPGGFGCSPVVGERVVLSPNGTNFLFWQDFELLHEKTIPVPTGPL